MEVETTHKVRQGFFKNLDLTSGNLFWKIPLFALPIILQQMFQLFYTTVDLWTVSQFGGGSYSMSAIGSNGALVNLLITMVLSLAIGVNVTLANAKGANDAAHASKILHSAMILALFAGIVFGAIGYFLSPYILEWMGTIPQILDKAKEYLSIYFLGLPFLMIYNYASQALRAQGDSASPFIILIIAGLANMLFDFLFVYFGGLDVVGVGVATLISEALSAFLSVLVLIRGKNLFVNFRFGNLCFDKDAVKEILRIGIPSGLQGVAFSIPNLLVQSSLYTITDAEIAVGDIVTGASASGQLEGYIYAIVAGFSNTMASFVAANYGAKNRKNVEKVFWFTHIWAFSVVMVASALCALFADGILSIFLKEGQGTIYADALQAAKQRFFVVGLTYVLDGIMDCNGSYSRGLRHSLAPALITIFGCTVARILFLVFLFPLPHFHNVGYLYAVFPVSWVIVDLAYVPILLTVRERAFKTIGISIEHRHLHHKKKAN